MLLMMLTKEEQLAAETTFMVEKFKLPDDRWITIGRERYQVIYTLKTKFLFSFCSFFF